MAFAGFLLELAFGFCWLLAYADVFLAYFGFCWFVVFGGSWLLVAFGGFWSCWASASVGFSLLLACSLMFGVRSSSFSFAFLLAGCCA